MTVAGEMPDWRRRVVAAAGAAAQPRRRRRAGARRPRPSSTRLGFGRARKTAASTVTVPSWRPDIEGEADLVEEVLARPRLRQYRRGAPAARIRVAATGARLRTQRRVAPGQASACRARHDGGGDLFLHARRAGAAVRRRAAALRLANPISADLDVMRPSILPNLAAAAKRNADRGFPDVALFEIGPAMARRHARGPGHRRRRPAAWPQIAASLGDAGPRCRCVRRQGRRARGAVRGRRAGREPAGRPRGARLVPSRPVRRVAAGTERPGAFRRAASGRAARVSTWTVPPSGSRSSLPAFPAAKGKGGRPGRRSRPRLSRR